MEFKSEVKSVVSLTDEKFLLQAEKGNKEYWDKVGRNVGFLLLV